MGCCVSTNTPSPPPPPKSVSSDPQYMISNSSKHNGGGGGKSPPPTYPLLLQEETVKQVLSSQTNIPSPGLIFHHESEKNLPHQDGNGAVFAVSGIGDDISEVDSSEICSTHSHSESVTTERSELVNNIAGGGSINETQRRRARFKNYRSFSSAKASPAQPSPRRRSGSPVIRSDSGTGRSRRSLGSGSGERTRSRKVEADQKEIENTWPPTSNELLENPLVSLECFIFL